MKPYTLLALLIALLFVGCATNSTPPGPPPFMGILNAKKLGTGSREYSQYEVKVHYENLVPGAYEIKIGFGYLPLDENLSKMAASSLGLYAIAHTEVVQKAAGDLVLTVEPSAVRNAGGKLDGKVHAILSKYPHGKEWLITRQDVFVLDPE